MNAVENFILDTDPETQEILEVLRQFILASDPHIREKISYGIPFFFRKKNICYLNPKINGVDLGFVSGTKLAFTHPTFELKDRKQVKTLHYTSVQEIDFTVLDKILQEAILIDDFIRE